MSSIEDETADQPRSGLVEHLPPLARLPVIGILRGYEPAAAIEAAGIARSGGIDVLEVTMDSPDATGVIRAIAERSADGQVGVGTVLRPDQVRDAADAGASFVVTPAFSKSVLSEAHALGLPVVAGVATTTEILTALDAGATAVKVFPAEQLGGPGYIRAVRGPMGHPPMVPTGGITPSNAVDYLESGAVAVGAGSSLFPSQVGRDRDWSALEAIVGEWMVLAR